MAIEIKYAVNMALQYNHVNEFDIEDYLISDNEAGKLFLTESPGLRVLNESEKSALYFLIDDNTFTASAFYEMYDSGGNKIDEKILELGYDHLVHNAIPVNLDSFYIDPSGTRMDVSLISNQNIITNGDFSQGSGDAFPGWILDPGNGTITQTTNGGVGGTRAIVLTRVTDSNFITSVDTINPGTTYTLSFYARSTSGTPTINISSNVSLFAAIPITNDFARYEIQFTPVLGDSLFGFVNATNNTSFILDDVILRAASLNYLTEIKSYSIDRECYKYSFQVNWLNKLGGRDTWMLGGNPVITTDVQRNELIEFSKLTNYESPKRIYGYRQNISTKTYTLSHSCKNRETAEWLKREIIDSIDVMIVINDYYYPVNVVNLSISEDKISHNYTVTFQFRLAFNTNIQTR